MEIWDRLGNLLYGTEDNSRSCSLDGLNLQNADLQGVDMPVYLDNTDLSFADLRGANFYWGTLIAVRFDGANLEGTDLSGTDLIRVDFRNTNLRNADIGPSGRGTPSSVYGYDFTGANLEGTIFTEAKYDEDTRFPEEFDKDKWGITFRSKTEWQAKPPTPPGEGL